jgi:hypothetical protein
MKTTITTAELGERYGDVAVARALLFAVQGRPYITPSVTPDVWNIERKLPTAERFGRMVAEHLARKPA